VSLQLKPPSNFHCQQKILAETEMQISLDEADIGGNNWFYSKAWVAVDGTHRIFRNDHRREQRHYRERGSGKQQALIRR
jgi:hypothetical protein